MVNDLRGMPKIISMLMSSTAASDVGLQTHADLFITTTRFLSVSQYGITYLIYFGVFSRVCTQVD